MHHDIHDDIDHELTVFDGALRNVEWNFVNGLMSLEVPWWMLIGKAPRLPWGRTIALCSGLVK